MSVSRAADNPLVGRTGELASLLARYEEAAAGRGGVSLIAGEPGIGKTRLAKAFAAEAAARGALGLWGRCFEGDWSPPLGPWSEAIGDFFRGLAPEARGALGDGGLDQALEPLKLIVPELGGGPAPSQLGADEDRLRLYDAVVRFFLVRAAERPVVVVLDDLHWADAASLDLLRHLAFFSRDARLLVLGTYRDLELDAHHPLAHLLPALRRETGTIPLQLKGLTVGDIEALISGSEPSPWAARLARTVHAETKGNPFFIEELLRHLADEAGSTGGGDWAPAIQEATISIPEGVRQVVARRLARLSQPTQRLLTHASVFTGGFDFPVLLNLVDLSEDELLDAIDEALAARMLEPAGGPERYDFVHAIVRHALSETWSPSRRVRLHRRAAEALAAAYAGRELEHAAELAIQYHRSVTLPGADAGLPYALCAAEQAARVYSVDGVVAFLRIARDLSSSLDPASRARLFCKLAIAEAEAVHPDAALAMADDALAALDAAGASPAETADFLADLTKALKQRAYVETSVWKPTLERGLALVGPADGQPWAKLRLLEEPIVPVSRAVIRAGRWIGFDPTAVAIARETGDEEDFARSYESFDPRSRAETEALVERARTWSRPAAVMYGLTVAANDFHYRHGAFRDAAALWQELIALGERYGAINWQAQATNQLTWLHIAAGRFDAARASEEAANALLTRLGPGKRSETLSMEMATSLAVYLGGAWDEIAAYWCASVDDPSLGPSDVGTLAATLYAGLAAYAQVEAGQTEPARALLRTLVDVLGEMRPTDTNHNGAVAWAGAAAWRLGMGDVAAAIRRSALDLIEAGIGDFPQTSNALTLARMAAMLGKRDEALEAFAAARRTLEATGQRPLLGIAGLDEAAVLARGGPSNYGTVVELLDQARAIFAELGMEPWLARATAARAEADARLGGRSVLPAGLTEREADVLRLVARGYSDRQISDELYISPRTVNAHLRNMLNKTGAVNRTELSIWAFEQKLVTRDESRVS